MQICRLCEGKEKLYSMWGAIVILIGLPFILHHKNKTILKLLQNQKDAILRDLGPPASAAGLGELQDSLPHLTIPQGTYVQNAFIKPRIRYSRHHFWKGGPLIRWKSPLTL